MYVHVGSPKKRTLSCSAYTIFLLVHWDVGRTFMYTCFEDMRERETETDHQERSFSFSIVYILEFRYREYTN